MPFRALYRTYLRALNRLPHTYLRNFFAVRARQDLENVVGTREPALRARKSKDVARRVKLINRATTQRDIKAFQRVLGLAYGRTGKLRWELLEPLTSTPGQYPHVLRRLLITPTPRAKTPFTPRDLDMPRAMPARINPESPDALLLGPLSKRREANIRSKAYESALRKVLPPLDQNPGTNFPQPLKTQGLGLTAEIEDVVGGTIFVSLPMTKRERRAKEAAAETSVTAAVEHALEQTSATPLPSPTRHPQRWVRRRYRSLLASIPQVILSPAGATEVHISPLSLSSGHRGSHYNPPADPVSLAWIESGIDSEPKNMKTNTKKTPKTS